MPVTPVTPGKARMSGLPTPSGIQPPGSIATPGSRSRAASTVGPAASNPDVDLMSRAFADAIKANDPARHRPYWSNNPSSLSPPSASSQFPSSGRQSAVGRPSSVASSSSTGPQRARTPADRPERPKTPATVRPPSRHSDVFARSSSRTDRAFEVGDNVRIESLGYEGSLRFIGEIDGKLGLWAGVELSGGFAGKGKNDGSVNGCQYFSCPPKCGVFVATSKLSPATVGRPPSVASLKNGRVTPSFSGRATPSSSASLNQSRASISNGRITPSNNGRVTPSMSTGRITPGMTPSAARNRRVTAKPPPAVNSNESTANDPSLGSKITAGSRASKYIGVTAKQLTTRDLNLSPRRSSDVESPSTRTISSPTRQPSSPFMTPKPGRSMMGSGSTNTTPSKIRPSFAVKGRIPSSIAMPPPSSPRLARSVSLNDHSDTEPRSSIEGSRDSYASLEKNSRALQDKIARLMAENLPSPSAGSPRAESAPAHNMSFADERLERSQARLDALEHENEQLRVELMNARRKEEAEKPTEPTNGVLEAENERLAKLVEELRSQLSESKESINAKDSELETLRQQVQDAQTVLEKVKADGEATQKTDRQIIGEHASSIARLEDLVRAKEKIEETQGAALGEKDKQLHSLQALLDKAYVEYDLEKKDLGAQIDELRQAGQETIALYEERLNASDSRRYELEDIVLALEAAKRSERPTSIHSNPTGNTAAEIDNETLRDQLHHLQKKVANLEEALEDSNTAAERDETMMRERIKRSKDKEDVMKKELAEGRLEVERMVRAEANARGRVAEIEEALRESTLALENAQAEVEGLRTELTSLDGLVEGEAGGGLSERFAEVAQKAAAERSRFSEEIASLSAALEEAKLSNPGSGQESELLETIDALSSRNSQLEAALEAAREKEKAAGVRDEIKGLKLIVQELQKENTSSDQRIKILESENKLLLAEAEQLRQDLKAVEDSLEQNIMREEEALESGTDFVVPLPSDSQAQVESLKQLKQKLESEVDGLRKKLGEAEMKNARSIHDLNKEIGELEALVESKIYREDELEQELERLREKLARNQKRTQKASLDMSDRHRLSVTSVRSSIGSPVEPSDQVVCEICERPGHDIFNCDLLKADEGTIRIRKTNGHQPINFDQAELFCVDCESHGHNSADCPHSLDVF